MLNNDLSEAFKKEVEDIVKKIGTNTSVANIEMEFSCPDIPDKKVYLCKEIESLTIEQDFVLNISDKITAELVMHRDPYIGMLYMRKNMFCQITITHTHPDKVVDDQEYKMKPAFEHKYKVLVTRYEDLFKKMSTEQLFPTKRNEEDHDQKSYRMSVQLIDEDVYKARKESLYFTGRDTSMADMMRYCINYFGFKKAYFCKPDNGRKYTNFVIPPSYGVEEIMSFLQNAAGLGIYNDGLISYISNGVWYVYPRYGEPVNKFTTEVYCLGGNKYIGLNRMDWDKNEGERKKKSSGSSSSSSNSSNSNSNSSSSSSSNDNNSDKSTTEKATDAAKAVNWKDTVIAGAKIYSGAGTADDYMTVANNAKAAYDGYNGKGGGDSNGNSDGGGDNNSDYSPDKTDEEAKPDGKAVGKLERGSKPIYIISPSSMNEKMYIAEGTENNVTGYVAQMSELVIDATRTLIDDENTKMEHRTHDPLVVPPDVMDFENFVRIKHVKSYGNLYKIASDLRSMMTRTLTFEWDHARPFTILPATAVFVHYDDHDKVQQHIGIAERCIYTYNKDKDTSTLFPRFTCTGEITVNVSVRGENLIQSQR